MTTDDLMTALPAAEDDYWELKSSIYLTPQRRGDLKRELGKQVSAFANTGGGALVFGISDTRQIEECELLVGRQSMKDFLSTMVEQSVEYPIRHFKIHQIPFTSDRAKSVFVLEIEDSPAAPHQAKDERCYYYRIDGHSKPAPHFHVELLRARMTKAVLEIDEIDYQFQTPSTGERPQLNLLLNVRVRNSSMQAATSWGVHVKMPWENYRWTVARSKEWLHDGVYSR